MRSRRPTRGGPAPRWAVGILALSLVTACDRGAPEADPESTLRNDSVLGLLLMIDDALRRGSEAALSDLVVDLDALRKRCPSVRDEDFEFVVSARAEDPLSACIELTDWSTLTRGVPMFPLSGGLNVDTKVCAKAWSGCEGVSRMCKSEIFYFLPEQPKAGFKVSLSGIVHVDGEYRLLRPPRCMAKGSNAR